MITYLMIKFLAKENTDNDFFGGFPEAICLMFMALCLLLDIILILFQPILIILYFLYKRALKKEKKKYEGHY